MDSDGGKLFSLEWLGKALAREIRNAQSAREMSLQDGRHEDASYYLGKIWGLHKAQEYLRAHVEWRPHDA